MQPVYVRTFHHFKWYERIGSLEKLRAESKVIQLLWKDFKDLQFVKEHSRDWKRKLLHSYNAILYELERFNEEFNVPERLSFSNYTALYKLVLCLVHKQIKETLEAIPQTTQVPVASDIVLESTKIWMEYNVGHQDYKKRLQQYTDNLVIPHLNHMVFVQSKKHADNSDEKHLSQRSTYCPLCNRNCAIFGVGTGRETVQIVCSHCEKANLYSLKHPNLIYLIAKLQALAQTQWRNTEEKTNGGQ